MSLLLEEDIKDKMKDQLLLEISGCIMNHEVIIGSVHYSDPEKTFYKLIVREVH